MSLLSSIEFKYLYEVGTRGTNDVLLIHLLRCGNHANIFQNCQYGDTDVEEKSLEE